jgi:hypothetical protein
MSPICWHVTLAFALLLSAPGLARHAARTSRGSGRAAQPVTARETGTAARPAAELRRSPCSSSPFQLKGKSCV